MKILQVSNQSFGNNRANSGYATIQDLNEAKREIMTHNTKLMQDQNRKMHVLLTTVFSMINPNDIKAADYIKLKQSIGNFNKPLDVNA